MAYHMMGITHRCQVHTKVLKKRVGVHRTRRNERSLTANRTKHVVFVKLNEKREKQLKKKLLGSLDNEILAIALPAFLALAADPIASIVDSAWIGRIGAAPLAASGIAIAVMNIVVKLFNTPLLSVTTSVIAKAYANPKENISRASSIAIELGLFSGAVQALLLFAGAPLAIHLMGVDPSEHQLWDDAVTFLRIRALGTPANVMLLATQGIFRGVGDTKSPLYATLGGNLINIILDPLLILGFGMGIDGAAWATVAAEYIASIYLVWMVQERIPNFNIAFEFEAWQEVKDLLGPSSTLVFRSLCVVSTYAIAASLSLKAGETSAAAHQVCHQLWLGSTLLADALAVAAQTLIAQNIVKDNAEKIREVTYKTCTFGLALGTLSALSIQLSHSILPDLFTSDADITNSIEQLLPFVIWTQPVTALAFVLDGVLYGGSDFNFATVAMFGSALPSIAIMLLSNVAEAPSDKMNIIWSGYSVLMCFRMLLILYRMQSKNGPYKEYFSK